MSNYALLPAFGKFHPMFFGTDFDSFEKQCLEFFDNSLWLNQPGVYIIGTEKTNNA